MVPLFQSPGISPDCHDFSNVESVLQTTSGNSLGTMGCTSLRPMDVHTWWYIIYITYSGGHWPDLYLEWEGLWSSTVSIRCPPSRGMWEDRLPVKTNDQDLLGYAFLNTEIKKRLRIHGFWESFCLEAAAKHKLQRLCLFNATQMLWWTWCSSFESPVLVNRTPGSHLCSL